MFSRSEIGLGTLYPRHLDVMQDYVSAMTLYRLSPSEGGLKERVLVLDWVGTDGLPDPFRLVWKASNGNLVARIGKGLFRISLGNYRANWFHDLDCRLLNWSGGEMDAAVSCSDGQDRRMTVPGSGLLMIDDDRYQRVLPDGRKSGGRLCGGRTRRSRRRGPERCRGRRDHSITV